MMGPRYRRIDQLQGLDADNHAHCERTKFPDNHGYVSIYANAYTYTTNNPESLLGGAWVALRELKPS